MRLPLLVAARPRSCLKGPVVPLPSGKWTIAIERVKDTILTLFVNGSPLAAPLAMVEGPCNIQVQFAHKGSEDYINVFAARS